MRSATPTEYYDSSWLLQDNDSSAKHLVQSIIQPRRESHHSHWDFMCSLNQRIPMCVLEGAMVQ